MKEAQEKANELIEKFRPHADDHHTSNKWKRDNAIQCAIIACKEIIDLDSGDSVDKDYWHSALTHLEKL